MAEGCWNEKAYWDALERARERSAGRKWEYGVSRPGVVRQGEIKSPEEAAQIRPSAGTTGTMPPDLSALQSGDGHDSPLELEQDMGIEIERQPIEV